MWSLPKDFKKNWPEGLKLLIIKNVFDSMFVFNPFCKESKSKLESNLESNLDPCYDPSWRIHVLAFIERIHLKCVIAARLHSFGKN